MFEKNININGTDFERTEKYMEQFYVYVDGKLDMETGICGSIQEAQALASRKQKKGCETLIRRFVTQHWDEVKQNENM